MIEYRTGKIYFRWLTAVLLTVLIVACNRQAEEAPVLVEEATAVQPTAVSTLPVSSPTVIATPSPTTLPTASPIPAAALNGRIVFDHEGDIYTMNADGSERRQLTTDPEWDFDAVWSPDGSQIAFRSHRDGDAEIYVMNADGSAQMNLTNYPANDDWSPAWSPDGTLIAFHSTRPEGSGLWLMNADGSDPHPIATPPGINEYPTWSPDSERLAFNCTFGRYIGGGKADFEICVVNADGSELIQLTDTEGNNKFPAWSPDGTQIAFTSDRLGWPSLPDYTPLGYDPENYGDEEVFLMNADGSNQVNLTNNPREGDDFPAWSQNGWIIFTRYGCLMVMNSDGSDLSQITQGVCADSFPDVSRDS